MNKTNNFFADKAFELVKEIHHSSEVIPPFNDEIIRQILEEIKAIFAENCAQATILTTSSDRTLWPLLNFRHAVIQRNKRCLLVYLNERLQRIKTMRWEFGSIVPSDIKKNFCEHEEQFFNNYSKSLATYMRSIGNGEGLDITANLKPPKSLYIEVRCVENFGNFELEDGQLIYLKKNSQHYLPRSQVENLIRQGILQHIA